ncbi:hypothetical protein FDT66_13740 [Polaribacter aestuariivivens]|uniref:TerB family tellurite resistance protein n=1 Tax=Polaribacter aestuariivivens TaxID=2304626 RepID=A0A5S3N0E9_9FLAO|nr:hypothetical protein [Polaribacter aestuariivivens]TMM28660.1 hypothetical protein FDT66_13740 [Polaribacter aestuariivivens]
MKEITIELKSHFLRLYQMAFSDDNFDTLELQMLYKFAEERGVSKEELEKILLQPSHNTSIPEKFEEKIEYLYDLAIMIWADNIVTEDEINTLKKYCLKFGFLKENIVELANFLLEKAKEKISKVDLIKQINQL